MKYRDRSRSGGLLLLWLTCVLCNATQLLPARYLPARTTSWTTSATSPLASRVIGRSHLEGLKQKYIEGYLKHRLEIAGTNEQLFSDEALLAIHQGLGGLPRKANLLAKGALVAAVREKCMVVSAEHVRLASTEIF